MKRVTFLFLVTLSVVVLLFGYDASARAPRTVASPPSAVSDGTAPASGTGSTTKPSGSSPTASRTVTGDVAQTQWGPVQVALEVRDRRISKVDVVQYPQGNPRDVEINDYALPILTRETTAAQGADIDMVSGATVTSTGYLQSLQSALDQAGL